MATGCNALAALKARSHYARIRAYPRRDAHAWPSQLSVAMELVENSRRRRTLYVRIRVSAHALLRAFSVNGLYTLHSTPVWVYSVGVVWPVFDEDCHLRATIPLIKVRILHLGCCAVTSRVKVRSFIPTPRSKASGMSSLAYSMWSISPVPHGTTRHRSNRTP